MLYLHYKYNCISVKFFWTFFCNIFWCGYTCIILVYWYVFCMKSEKKINVDLDVETEIETRIEETPLDILYKKNLEIKEELRSLVDVSDKKKMKVLIKEQKKILVNLRKWIEHNRFGDDDYLAEQIKLFEHFVISEEFDSIDDGLLDNQKKSFEFINDRIDNLLRVFQEYEDGHEFEEVSGYLTNLLDDDLLNIYVLSHFLYLKWTNNNLKFSKKWNILYLGDEKILNLKKLNFDPDLVVLQQELLDLQLVVDWLDEKNFWVFLDRYKNNSQFLNFVFSYIEIPDDFWFLNTLFKKLLWTESLDLLIVANKDKFHKILFNDEFEKYNKFKLGDKNDAVLSNSDYALYVGILKKYEIGDEKILEAMFNDDVYYFALWSLFEKFAYDKSFLRVIYRLFIDDLMKSDSLWLLFVDSYRREYKYNHTDLSEIDMDILDMIEVSLLKALKFNVDLSKRFDVDLFSFLWFKVDSVDWRKDLLDSILNSNYKNSTDLLDFMCYSVADSLIKEGAVMDEFFEYFFDVIFSDKLEKRFYSSYNLLYLLVNWANVIEKTKFCDYVDKGVVLDDEDTFASFWYDMKLILSWTDNVTSDSFLYLLDKSLSWFQYLREDSFYDIFVVLVKMESVGGGSKFDLILDKFLGKLYDVLEWGALEISDFQIFWDNLLSYDSVLGEYKFKFLALYEKNNVSLQKYKDNTIFLWDCVYISSGDGRWYTIWWNLKKYWSSGAKIQTLFGTYRNKYWDWTYSPNFTLSKSTIFDPSKDIAGGEILQFKKEMGDAKIKYLSLFIGYNDFCGLGNQDLGYHKLVFAQLLAMVDYINMERDKKWLEHIHFFVNTVPPFARYSSKISLWDYKRQLVKFVERRKYNNLLRSLKNFDITVVDAASSLWSKEGSKSWSKIIKAYEEIIRTWVTGILARKIMLSCWLKKEEIFMSVRKGGPIPYSEFLNDEWNNLEHSNEYYFEWVPEDWSTMKDDSDSVDYTTDGMHLTRAWYSVLKKEILKEIDGYVNNKK